MIYPQDPKRDQKSEIYTPKRPPPFYIRVPPPGNILENSIVILFILYGTNVYGFRMIS